MRTLRVTAVLLAGAIAAAGPAAGAPQSCADVGGVVQAGGDCRVQASEPAYLMDITFPLDYPDEQAILDYIGQTRDGFVNVASTPEPRNHPFEMDIVSESLASAQTRSVVLKLFQDAGGAHPTSWFKSFTFDTVRGAPVTFDTLLAGSISPGDGMDPTLYQNFAVTDDAVIFYFGRAELLPSYAGERSVTIPRTDLPPLQL